MVTRAAEAEPLLPTNEMSRFWKSLAVIAIVIVGAWFVFPRVTQGQAKSKPSQAQQQAARAVPVVAVAALQGDMPVYLAGIGTVTSLKSVAVKSRVDGQLIKIDFREGQLVRQGQVLAELDPRPFKVQLEQAEGQQAKDLATLQNAKVDLDRYQILVEQNSIPRQQRDAQAAAVAQDEGALKADQGQVDSAKLNLVYAAIASPITGRVGLRQVDVGNMVHAADQNGIVMMTQVSPISVVFTIPEDALPQVLPKVRAGQKLPVDAFDRDLKTKLASGALLTTDNQVDQATATVRLKAEFANQDEQLFPNQFVNARLLVDTIRGTVIVPSAAVQRSTQTTFVYVVKPDNTVEARNVVVGLVEDDRTSIKSGVKPGEIVVTDGLDKLQQGTHVAVGKNNAGKGDASANQ